MRMQESRKDDMGCLIENTDPFWSDAGMSHS